MLYKAPGPHEIHGGRFDTLIVDEGEVEGKVADGWSLTTTEAKAAYEEAKLKEQADKQVVLVPNDNAPATRAELEAKAAELGLSYHPNTGDKKLGEMIEAKLKEQA